MTTPPAYDPQTVAIRQDLADAIERAWRHLASHGTWWTGAQRLAMVAETRNAVTCPLCLARKAALSPYTLQGTHQSPGALPETVVDVIHRVRTDAGRLTESWLQRTLAAGLTDAEYVEIVGVVATVTALDTFSRALGQPLRPLPQPRSGEPTRRRPKNARKQIAWVPTVLPNEITPEDGDPFRYGGVHIQQALSLVPDTVAGFFDLDVQLYLMQDHIRDFGTEYRAISHAQIELIAAKASHMNGCFY
jgi:alkylhydroperoxidase family enzyme